MPFEPAGAVAFLMESQRRVISHCERLLPANDLTSEDRARLVRLAQCPRSGTGPSDLRRGRMIRTEKCDPTGLEKFLDALLKSLAVFLSHFLPRERCAGRQLRVRHGRRTGLTIIRDYGLAFLRIHLALWRTWL